MANLIAAATGNFTTASTWQTVDSASELDSEAGNTAISTSNLDSSTFIPASTIDGVALKLNARASSPTGTFTVTLKNNTSSGNREGSVTVNISDLPANPKGVWVFFKFTGSAAVNGTDSYFIRVVCSNTGSQVTLYRNATSNNWSRKLRTTTTQAPAANNHLVISNELTGAGTSNTRVVTMDNTTVTTWGPSTVNTQGITVGAGGTLTLQTSASTNYSFKWRGIFLIAGGGIVNFGTSGTVLPSTSTLAMLCDVSTDGDTKIQVDSDGTMTIFGAAKTPYTRLTSDYTSGTGITVADTTGWQNSDLLAFSPTGSSATQYETKAIAASGGVSGTSVTLVSGLSNAHKGTSPQQGYVLNLTRNITLAGTSTSLRGLVWVFNTGALDCEYLQVDASTMGNNYNQGTNAGPTFLSTSTGVVKYYGCAVNNSTSNPGNNRPIWEFTAAANSFILDHNVSYDFAGPHYYIPTTLSAGSPSYTINCCVAMKNNDNVPLFWILAANSGMTYTSNVGISCVATGTSGVHYISDSANAQISLLDATKFDGNESWYSSSSGIIFITSSNGMYIALQNCITNRNTGSGILFASIVRRAVLTNCSGFGNGLSSTQHAGVRISSGGVAVLNSCTYSGDTTVASSIGLASGDNTNSYPTTFILYNCSFGNATGIFTTFTTADISLYNASEGPVDVWANKTIFGSSTTFQNLTDAKQQAAGDHIDGGTFLRSQRHGGTTGDHRLFAPQGTIRVDSSVFHTAAPSEKLTPNTASYKLRSGRQICSVSSGVSRTVAVYVRQSKSSTGDSADYNGAQPRLILRRNDAIGVSSDTVIATGTVAIGNWEQLTGVAVASPSEDGAIEVYVDCDGTTGFINVDDYSIS